MRVLTAVIEVAALAMFHPRQDLPLRGTIALQFIRDDDSWDVLTSFEQLGPAGAFQQKPTVSPCKKTRRWPMNLILIS